MLREKGILFAQATLSKFVFAPILKRVYSNYFFTEQFFAGKQTRQFITKTSLFKSTENFINKK